MIKKKHYQWLIFFIITITMPIHVWCASTKSAKAKILTNQWAVKLLPGKDPEHVAKSMGASNKGPVASLQDTYLFVIPDSLSLTHHTRARVKKNSDIIWTKQQVKRWRFLRKIPHFSDPLFPNQWHLINSGQSGGTPGEDVDILPVWEDGLSGEGIVIGIVDDGLQHDHPDLSENYISAFSYDFNDNDSNPYPDLGNYLGEGHGTSVAGVSAARENNGTCGVGAAFRASLAGLRLLASETTDAEEANALSYRRDKIHIYNNSWGPLDGDGPDGPGPLTLEAIEDNIRYGRNGMGSIYVFAAGNGLQYADNVNLDGYANLRFVIAVSAVDQFGQQSYYSEPGACVLVCAPSDGRLAGIYTTDLMGHYGDAYGDCTDSFGGTSSAAPLVSGIIALILEENPNLTWRDVQHILLKSAQKNDPDDSDWQINGAGLHINHKYGFGRIHTEHAVKLARHWQSVSEEKTVSEQNYGLNLSIPNNTGAILKSQVYIHANLSVEHVAVILTTDHSCSEQLNIKLISPSGTSSTLIESHSASTTYDEWMFSSVRHWGESSDGQWTLEIQDTNYQCKGTLKQWQLVINGEEKHSKVNQLPIAVTDYIQVLKNRSVSIHPLLNDFDADSDPLQIVNISQPVHGKLVASDHESFLYVPNKDFMGYEELEYTISDDQTNNSGKIFIEVLDFQSATNNQSHTIPDSDPLGAVSKIQIDSAGQLKEVEITIQISHDHIDDLSAYLITPNNDQFLLFSNLDTTQTLLNLHLSSASEKYLSDATPPYNESYLPFNSFNTLKNTFAVGQWQLLLVDNQSGNLGMLNSWTIQITCSKVEGPTAPKARPDQFHTYPNLSVCMNVLNNDSDPNGQKLNIQSIEQPSHGTVFIDDCGIYYQPKNNFLGTDTLRYYAVNESGQNAVADVEILVVSDLALSFDGMNDCVSCGKPEPLNIQSQLSIELWIHPTNYGELDIQGFGRLIDRERYILFLNESGRDDYADNSLMFAIEHQSGALVMGNTPRDSIQLNKWQHIAACYNRQTSIMSIYINGQQQVLSFPFQRPYGPINNSQSNIFYIGESNNKDRAFQGMMDEIRIWNIIRSSDEIQSYMNQSFSTLPEGLAAYWPIRPFESYLKDMTSNEIHCRIQSPKWVPGIHQLDIPGLWAENDIIYTKMNTSITFYPLENDEMPETPVSIQVSPLQSHPKGQIQVKSDYSLNYIPDTSFLGSDTFVYTISTNEGYAAGATIQINVVSDFALYFDKNSDYVHASHSDKWSLDGPMTFSAWIRPVQNDAANNYQEKYIMDKKAFSIFINHKNNTYYSEDSFVYWQKHSDGTWFASSSSNDSVQWNHWQHIAIVDNHVDKIRIYINGELQKLRRNGVYSNKRASHAIYPFILGNASDFQHAFLGSIDEVYVWSEALTQAQIQQTMYSCFPGQSEKLLAYWPISDSGNFILSHSKYALHGIISDVEFVKGVLPRYPVSVETIISGLKQINGMEGAPVCMEDYNKNLFLSLEEILFMFNQIGGQNK